MMVKVKLSCPATKVTVPLGTTRPAKSVASTPVPVARLYRSTTTQSVLPPRVSVTLKAVVVPAAPSKRPSVDVEFVASIDTRAGTMTPVTASAIACSSGVFPLVASATKSAGCFPPLAYASSASLMELPWVALCTLIASVKTAMASPEVSKTPLTALMAVFAVANTSPR